MSEMTKEAAAARIDELRAVMKKNSYLYYVQDNPLITDAEYDAMMRELKELEAQYPELVTPDSPSQHVGGYAKPGFTEVKHMTPLLSLANAFSPEEMEEFDRRAPKSSMWWSPRSMDWPAALSMRTAGSSGRLPEVMGWWEKMSRKTSGPSPTSPKC